MIRALPEMLNCLNTIVNQNGNTTDMSILERQGTQMKWQQEQSYFNGNEFNLLPLQAQAQHFDSMVNNDLGLGELVTRVVKMDPGLENDWSESGDFGVEGSGFGSGIEMNYAIPRTASCPRAVAACDITRRESILQEKLSYAIGRESFKKRKADMSHNIKVVAKEETKDKRLKGVAKEGESKITEENSNGDKKTNKRNNNNRENSADTSKDNSKVSEVRKPDYIHVRARRGQATDSHSLAERVRREKISERMKYLQDLVPGCNKITGKAGMLDEIINYVQSLQRQVEFLSMKLAAVNPRLDFNMDNFFAKEAFPACTSNFPTIGVSPEMANQRYLQLNSLQQLVSCTTPDMAVQRSISAPISIPETFLDSSYFNAIQPSSTWDTDLQNLFSMEFPQGRSTSFPSQHLIGSSSTEAGSLKMEM